MTEYDAENHTISRHQTFVRKRTNANTGAITTTSGDWGTTTIGWGPNGHPILMTPAPGGVQPQPITLHWDGDIVLFVTDGNAGNSVVDFKIGLDGEITPRDTTWSGLTAYDRDVAGVIIGGTTSSGSLGLYPLDAVDGGPTDASFSPGYNRSGSAVAVYLRPDGFSLAGVQINGVRAFDPALQSWTTPDAFEGDIHDPASQQKYMWNRGNPVDYSDPTGYKPEDWLIIFPPAQIAYMCGSNVDQCVDAVGLAFTVFETGGVRGPAPRGGVGPVNKGKLGEALSEQAATARGERIVGRQLSLRTPSGLWRKIDIVTEANGKTLLTEAKMGTGRLTAAQRKKDAEIARAGGTFFGKNAEAANVAGKTIGPTDVRVDHW